MTQLQRTQGTSRHLFHFYLHGEFKASAWLLRLLLGYLATYLLTYPLTSVVPALQGLTGDGASPHLTVLYHILCLVQQLTHAYNNYLNFMLKQVCE